MGSHGRRWAVMVAGGRSWLQVGGHGHRWARRLCSLQIPESHRPLLPWGRVAQRSRGLLGARPHALCPTSSELGPGGPVPALRGPSPPPCLCQRTPPPPGFSLPVSRCRSSADGVHMGGGMLIGLSPCSLGAYAGLGRLLFRRSITFESRAFHRAAWQRRWGRAGMGRASPPQLSAGPLG